MELSSDLGSAIEAETVHALLGQIGKEIFFSDLTRKTSKAKKLICILNRGRIPIHLISEFLRSDETSQAKGPTYC